MTTNYRKVETDCNWDEKRLGAVPWLAGCCCCGCVTLFGCVWLLCAWTAACPDHTTEGGRVSYQQQICVQFRGLVWDEKSTSGKLLSEVLLLSEVIFSWRVIVSSGTRNCFVRSLRRRVESSFAGNRKTQVLIENRGAAFFCLLEGCRNWNTE